MSQHPSVSNSFFIRFLLITAIIGNLYLMVQSACHTVNFHKLDLYLRFYGFITALWLNIILFAGTSLAFWGALQIFKNGISSYKVYFTGKLITCAALLILTITEYNHRNISFPLLLVPVMIAVESIYPILLYISLRKNKARR